MINENGIKMSTGWLPIKIYCSNCHYEGRAKLKSTGCLGWIILLGLFFISFLFWSLFMITGLSFFYLLLRPSKQICPKCGWEFPIPFYRNPKDL
jgi:hypothetical protein